MIQAMGRRQADQLSSHSPSTGGVPELDLSKIDIVCDVKKKRVTRERLKSYRGYLPDKNGEKSANLQAIDLPALVNRLTLLTDVAR